LTVNNIEVIRVCDIDKIEIKTLGKEYKIIDVLKLFRESEDPVVAIVDMKGKPITVVYERELLRSLTPVK